MGRPQARGSLRGPQFMVLTTAECFGTGKLRNSQSPHCPPAISRDHSTGSHRSQSISWQRSFVPSLVILKREGNTITSLSLTHADPVADDHRKRPMRCACVHDRLVSVRGDDVAADRGAALVQELPLREEPAPADARWGAKRFQKGDAKRGCFLKRVRGIKKVRKMLANTSTLDVATISDGPQDFP